MQLLISIILIIYLSISTAGCTKRHKPNIIFLNFTVNEHQFNDALINFTDITLHSKHTKKNVIKNKAIDFSRSAPTTKIITANFRNYYNLDIEMDLQHFAVTPKTLQDLKIIKLWSEDGDSIPDESSVFKINVPIKRLNTFSNINNLNIDFDIDSSFKPLFAEPNYLHYMFTPYATASITEPTNLRFEVTIDETIPSLYTFTEQGLVFNLIVSEETQWLDNVGAIQPQSMHDLAELRIPINVIGDYIDSNGHTLKAKIIRIDQSAIEHLSIDEPDLKLLTGIIKIIDGLPHLTLPMSDHHQPLPIIINHLTHMRIDDNIIGHSDFDETWLVPFQNVEVQINPLDEVIAIKLLSSMGLVFFKDNEFYPLYINDIAMDEDQKNHPIFFDFRDQIPPQEGLFEIMGVLENEKFIVYDFKQMDINNIAIHISTLSEQEHTPIIINDENQKEIRFPQSFITHAFIDTEIKNIGLKVNTAIDNLFLQNQGQFELLVSDDEYTKTVRQFQQASDFLAALEERMINEEIAQLSGNGNLRQNDLLLTSLTINLRKNKLKLPVLTDASKDNTLSPWQKGTIATGAVIGATTLFTLARWYNTTLEKPWLDRVYQSHAHSTKDKDREQFANAITLDLTTLDQEGKPKYSEAMKTAIKERANNQTFDSGIETLESHQDNIKFKIKSEILDGDNQNKVEYYKNFIGAGENSNKKVILYLPGLGEHVGVNKKLKLIKGIDPLEEVGKGAKADVYSINMPPYGQSNWGTDRFDLNNALAASQLMLKYLQKEGYKIENIYLWSWSIGGNTAIKLAEENKKIGGLILDSPPTRVEDLFTNRIVRLLSKLLYPFIISKKQFNVDRKYESVKDLPTLITHHRHDEFVKLQSASKAYFELNELTLKTNPAIRAHRKTSPMKHHFVQPDTGRIDGISEFINKPARSR